MRGSELVKWRYERFFELVWSSFNHVMEYYGDERISPSSAFASLEQTVHDDRTDGVMITPIGSEPTLYRILTAGTSSKKFKEVATGGHYFWTEQNPKTYIVDMRYNPPWYDEFKNLCQEIDFGSVDDHAWSHLPEMSRVLPPAPLKYRRVKINWQRPQAVRFQGEWGYPTKILKPRKG